MNPLASRLRDLFDAGGFWREHWQRAGRTSAPERLDSLPVVRPDHLAADEREHPPYGSWRAGVDFVRVGIPVAPGPLEMIVFAAADLEREARVGARALAAAGLAAGMRETNTLPGGLPTPGSLIVGDAVQALGALDMPVGPIDAEGPRATALDFWTRVRPDFAVLDPAGVRALAALLAERRITADAIGLRGAALVTDLADPEVELPSIGVPVIRIVGRAEAFSLLAARERDGAYFVPADEVVVEVLDGELLLTTLHHSASLVRYAPGIRARPARRSSQAEPGEVGFRLD